jgi:hypothetical protein
MLDLFCGRWGWSRAFAARGWECVGVDLVEPPEVPQGCRFFQADVLQLQLLVSSIKFNVLEHLFWPSGYSPDFICASSPCEDFSTMRNFQPPVPYPELGIKLFKHTRSICEASGIPYVMENVAGAGRYVGRAVNHCGSYYLWGSGVPPILPQNIRKGMTRKAMGLREKKGQAGWNNRHGQLGQTPSALVATIPPELANCVADYAERLLEQTHMSKTELLGSGPIPSGQSSENESVDKP